MFPSIEVKISVKIQYLNKQKAIEIIHKAKIALQYPYMLINSTLHPAAKFNRDISIITPAHVSIFCHALLVYHLNRKNPCPFVGQWIKGS
jgi:hypothetical protein